MDKIAQAQVLTDKEIIETYDMFENDGKTPKGIDIENTFTETMGRAVISNEIDTQLILL